MANDIPPIKPPMPPQPVTRDLPAADKAALQFAELRMLLINGFKVQDDKIEARFVQLEANFELKSEQIQGIQIQVGELVTWKTFVNDKLKTNSIRAQASSSADLDHEAKLAANIVKVQSLETAIHETRDIVEKQSDFMGMGRRGLLWFASKEGRVTMTQIALLAGVVYTTLKTAGVIK